MEMYRHKLDEANQTIINLLEQKVKCIKKNSDKSIDKNKFPINTRTRVMSLLNVWLKINLEILCKKLMIIHIVLICI